MGLIGEKERDKKMEKTAVKILMFITGILVAVSTFAFVAFGIAKNFVMMAVASVLLIINALICKEEREILKAETL